MQASGGPDLVSIVVLLIFIGTYVVISSEKVNRTATSLLGLGLMGLTIWAAGIGTFSTLVEQIEWHIVLFVMAMMVIVTIASGSGMFQFLAIELARPTASDTRRLFITLLSFVFVISLFLDTTTTVLIMAPLTIEICKGLELDFRPFLISEAVVCNFASIPSVVGAVPNLVIAGETGLDAGFMFIALLPLAVILFLVSVPIFLRYFSVMLCPSKDELVDELSWVDATYMIRSQRDFYASIIAMILLALGFVFGNAANFEPSMVAIIVAAVLLIETREKVDDVLTRVNWGTVFFLVGLFGLVAALDITGIITLIGELIGLLVGDNALLATIFMIWVPGLLSAVVDNIPISAVVAPIAYQFAYLSPLLPLALILGVNVGGFILPIGAPANILVMAMSEKEHKRISMIEFARIATPLGLMMLAIGTGWLVMLSFLMGL
jgi:Na+/H+ antiporter NhaD/arsenite permease-like protein